MVRPSSRGVTYDFKIPAVSNLASLFIKGMKKFFEVIFEFLYTYQKVYGNYFRNDSNFPSDKLNKKSNDIGMRLQKDFSHIVFFCLLGHTGVCKMIIAIEM